MKALGCGVAAAVNVAVKLRVKLRDHTEALGE